MLPDPVHYRIKKDTPGAQHFTDRQQKGHEERLAFFGGDEAMNIAEQRVFQTTMQASFDELLGRGWGNFHIPFTSIKRFQDTARLLELIELVRNYYACTTMPSHVTFIVEPLGDMTEDLEEIKEREKAEAEEPDADWLIQYYDEEQVLEENEEGRRAREERYQLLQREHQTALQGEAVTFIDVPKEKPAAEPEADEEIETHDGNDDDKGGVAIAPPPTPPPDKEVENLSDALMFYIDVWENGVSCLDHWANRAEYSLGKPFVEWTEEKAES